MFGHPKGLKTLFFTELWERLSYYGMRALLTLFLVATVEQGGFGLTKEMASAIYGLYTAMAYLVALPGGWIADRILGMRRSVFLGGGVIACGHFSMAVPTQETFYLGLILIVIGTGLLKPNISALVGELYPEGGARRDSGFSIYYMGINLGAFFGPLICGYLGQAYSGNEPRQIFFGLQQANWHWGFAAAGVGMVLGLIQYRLGYKNLGEAGGAPKVDAAARSVAVRQLLAGIGGVVLLTIVFGTLQATGFIAWTVSDVAKGLGWVIALVVISYFVYVLAFGRWEPVEKKRIFVIFILMLVSAMFWAGFEQAGSSMTFFADSHTDLSMPDWVSGDGQLGGRDFWWQLVDTGESVVVVSIGESPSHYPSSWLVDAGESVVVVSIGESHPQYPSSWFQSVNPLFIIILAPCFSWLWIWLGHRNPSIAVKFGMGLLLLSSGFVVLGWGAVYANEAKVSASWLVVTYFFHTLGELCLSPVGLSSVTKLSPKPLTGQMMGMWFTGTALGTLIAGLYGGLFDQMKTHQLFWMPAAIGGGFAILLMAFKGPIKKLCCGVK